MRPFYNLILLAVVAVTCITACSKKTPQSLGTIPSETVPASSAPTSFGTGAALNKVFRELRTTPETKCIPAGKLQKVTFSKGTTLTFYPNSFKDGTGKIITSGTVCVSVVEMQKPGDMIANRATTMTSTGYILRSGGQVHITATKDGQTVHARKYGIDFKQPAGSTNPMALYFGNTQNKDSVVIWGNAMTGAGMTAPATSDTTPLAPGDTVVWGAGLYYQFDSCTDFNYVNCDYFYTSTAAKTTVKVVVADLTANLSNTEVFIVFPTLNAVMPLGYQNGAVATFKTAEVPEGLTAHVVVISKKENNQYYYWEALNFNVTPELQLDAFTTPQTIGYVKNKLSTLP